MGDCLLALQQCSLIGLEDSPQLLVQSVLQHHHDSKCSNRRACDKPEGLHTPQRLDFAAAGAAFDDATATSAAAGHSLAALVQAAAAGGRSGSLLECSLPLFSESPAILGRQPPRSRFRRGAKEAAAAAQAAAGATGQGAAAPADDNVPVAAAAEHAACSDSQKAGKNPSCLHEGLQSASFSAAEQPGAACSNSAVASCMPCTAVPAAELQQQGLQQCDSKTHADADAGSQHPKGDWSLLQQLLDESSCSSATCLPHVLAEQHQQQPTPAGHGCQQWPQLVAVAPAATAADAVATPCPKHAEWGSSNGGAGCDLTRSTGSDITGFRGFWAATPHTHSGAVCSPAPLGQQHQVPQPGQVSPGGASSNPAEAEAESASVQQRNAALLMLLSLEDSMVLRPTNQAQSAEQDAAVLAHANSSPEQQPPGGDTAAEPADETAACFTSLEGLPDGQLVLQKSWSAAVAAADGPSARYAADCWASADGFGSPGVLMSSPVLDDNNAGVSSTATSAVPKTVSRLQPAIETPQMSAAEPVASREGLSHAEPAPAPSVAAAAASGMSSSSGRPGKRGNAFEYSPIRGLTLWAEGGCPTAENMLATVNVGVVAGSPTWTQQPQLQQQQQHLQQQEQEQDSGGSGTEGTNSSCCHFQQLQRLLGTASPVVEDDWHDPEPSPAAQRIRQQQHQQQGDDEHAGAGEMGMSLDEMERFETAREYADDATDNERPENIPAWPETNPATPPADTVQSAQQQQLQDESEVVLAAAVEACTPVTKRGPGASTLASAAATPTTHECSPGPRASPAESMDSFYGAAAGDPYSASKQSPRTAVRRSLSWHDGLGSLLAPGGEAADHPPTPATVMCKDGWGPAAASAWCQHQDKTCAPAAAQPPKATMTGGPGVTGTAARALPHCSSDVSELQDPSAAAAADEMAGGSSTDRVATAADWQAIVADLKQQLRDAELRCTQQQKDVNQARQLVLQKELQVHKLKAVLARSEQEGSGCLEALAAAMDIMTAAEGDCDDSNSPQDMKVSSRAACTAATDPGVSSSNSSNLELSQLRQQCQALQQHNAALQSTLAEAGQQLDLFEGQVQDLSAAKEAAEQQLLAAQQQAAQQQAEQEAFLQNELEEQQQQHETEVGQLHDRLRELSDQLQHAQQASAASRAAADQSQDEAASLSEQLLQSKQCVDELKQQLQVLQQTLHGQESESAASSEQLSRQVAQLMAAKQELQEANARLLEAEAEYASNQLTLGCHNQELSGQLQDALAANKQLQDVNEQLQAQNASLSKMVQSLRAKAPTASEATSTISTAAAAGLATPTTSTAQSRPAASQSTVAAVDRPSATGDEGPTPMRRRMASMNAQLERRCQELLQQKQALAAQVDELQQQLEQTQQQHVEGSATGAILQADAEQHQAQLAELQHQVDHLVQQNDDLVRQLEELDWAHEQTQAEKLELQALVAELQQGRQQLLEQVQQLQQQLDAAAAAAPASSNGEEQEQLLFENARLSQECQTLQEKLTDMQQLTQCQAEQQQEQQQQQQPQILNSTALFERCSELETQVQDLQQQVLQREQQLQRMHGDEKSKAALGARQQQQHKEQLQQQQEALVLLQERVQELEEQLAEQREQQQQTQQQHEMREAELQTRCQKLAADLGAARQQLSNLQLDFDKVNSSRAQLAADHSKLSKAAAAAEAGRLEVQETLAVVREENHSLVEHLVQLQLAEPPTTSCGGNAPKATMDSTAVRQVATAEKGAQTANCGAPDADSSAAAAKPAKKRWTTEAAVQAELGGTDAEQATAVQQLLLLQAQTQLQEMEEQNRKAAQRLVESKKRIAQLQTSLTQQEAALELAQRQLEEAKQQHTRQTASLQHENEQLVKQLADTRVQVQVLQTANKHLECRVQQQQKELQDQAAAASTAHLQVQELTHQRHLDRLHVSSAAAELQAAKDHAQQLLAARDKEAQAVAALQQRLQQMQQEGHAAAAAAAAARDAAVASVEGRLQRQLENSKQQVAQAIKEKEALMVELQQTKVAVDFLEDSVRRLGQHNAQLVQQLKQSLAPADSSSPCTTSITTGATSTTSAVATLAAAAAGPASVSKTAAGQPVSPRTLHSIIAAATRVNEKNKKLKRQLQSMQQASAIHGATP